jgi:predicted small lipoprotein YifL
VLVRVTAKGIGAGVVVAALAFGLAACGVRGSLDPPPGAKAAGTAKSAEAAGTQPDSAAPPKPHEGFILDPLLR